MRALISELGRDPVEDGLVAALAKHGSRLDDRDGLTIDVQGPDGRLALSRRAEIQLFGIGREALANAVEARRRDHGVGSRRGSTGARARRDQRRRPRLRPGCSPPGHFGLESMRSRAAEIGGLLTITSTPGLGTVVRVEVPADTEGASNGA